MLKRTAEWRFITNCTLASLSVVALLLSVGTAEAKGKFEWWIGKDGYVSDARIVGEWRMTAAQGRKVDEDIRLTVSASESGKVQAKRGVYTISIKAVPPSKWNMHLAMADLGANRYAWVGLVTPDIEESLSKTDAAVLLHFVSLRYEIVRLDIQEDRVAVYDMYRLLAKMNQSKVAIQWSTDAGNKMIMNHIDELETMLASAQSQFQDVIPDAVFEKVIRGEKQPDAGSQQPAGAEPVMPGSAQP